VPCWLVVVVLVVVVVVLVIGVEVVKVVVVVIVDVVVEVAVITIRISTHVDMIDIITFIAAFTFPGIRLDHLSIRSALASTIKHHIR
jgi:hypothetical protein